MALYKGIELSPELTSSIRYMEEVEEYREELRMLQTAWDNLALLGRLSGTQIDIGSVRSDFARLTAQLVNQLGLAQREKAARDLLARAQVSIDVLVRNLFERTADIGFLATDLEICRFAAADADTRSRERSALVERFRDYQRKYTVYEDVLLLSPEGVLLARLADEPGLEQTRDPLVRECLETRAPYVEVYRKSELAPQSDRALLYAYRVATPGGGRPVGVLCLVFGFEDECERIFSGLVTEGEACVLGMLDARGYVLASSEPRELPVGARVPTLARPGSAGIVRFAGRPFLAVRCEAAGYQGYMGPGWAGFAMAPLELAFGVPHDERVQEEPLAADTVEQVLGSERLFSAELRAIPEAALRIQSELHRAVWNGNVALAQEQGISSTAFSKTLLGEIGATGGRTRDVFSRALDNLHSTVLSSTLRDVRARAALATDIMDRNLYERANDCRWWALTPAFRAALEQRDARPETRRSLTEILVTINGLYTVYTSLLLFDAEGVVVACSSPEHQELVGSRLDASFVADTLRLKSREDYCVSDFAATPLYGGRPSYVFCAGVRGLRADARVVGGVAIVFDSEPQLRAMLEAALPCDAAGAPVDGAFGVLVDARAGVVSSTRADLPVGSPCTLGEGGLLHAGEAAAARVIALGSELYALGAVRSTGYREYKGPSHGDGDHVQAVIAVPLCPAGRAAPVFVAPPQRASPRAALPRDAATIDLALVSIAGAWYALPASELVEAVSADRLTVSIAVVPNMCGYLSRGSEALIVVDAAPLLGARGRAQAPVDRHRQELVVVRPRDDRGPFALLVDALGDTPELPVASLTAVPDTLAEGAGLVEWLVRDDSGNLGPSMVPLLSVSGLAALARGMPAPAARSA